MGAVAARDATRMTRSDGGSSSSCRGRDAEAGVLKVLAANCCHVPRIPLYQYSELPTFLQGNPYVVSGYRVKLSRTLCIKSLFVWNNETVNIWSHLIGFIIFFYLFVTDNFITLPALRASIGDHVVLSVTLLCYQICMLSSCGYHLFFCHSEQMARRWFAIDLAGISIGFVGCYLPGIYYAFYCLWLWRDVYVVLLSVLFANVLYWQTQPHYYTERWFHVRWLLYCGLTAFGVVPTVHWVYLSGGLGSQIAMMFLPKMVVMYVLLMVAFAFYITKVPERCCPGMFDYVGYSHQWWHIMTLTAFYWWHSLGIELVEYHQQNVCNL